MSLRPAALSVSLSLALAASALTAPAMAQMFANPDPAAVKPGAYVIEPTHTRVLFSVSHMGFTTYYGEFPGASGQLTLDPAHPEASRLDVTVPIGGVTTTSAKLDGELRSPDWFDAARFPTAMFHSTHITLVGSNDAEVAGDLTLHGVTRPVVLHAHFNGAGVNPVAHDYTAGFEVSGVIKRSQFGVSKYVPLIGDDTRLIVSAAFDKAKG